MKDEKKKNRDRSSTSVRRTATEPSASRKGTREPAGEVSRGKRASQPGRLAAFVGRLAGAGPLAWVVLALGLIAAALMVLTEFSTIHSVRLGSSTCGAADVADQDKCLTSGGEQHGYALIGLALLTVLMTVGAVAGRSRPAAVALGVIGLVVLGIALLLDLPTLDSTRGFETRYNDVKAQTGGAFKLELIAGVLAVVAAGLALLREQVMPRRERKADAAASEA